MQMPIRWAGTGHILYHPREERLWLRTRTAVYRVAVSGELELVTRFQSEGKLADFREQAIASYFYYDSALERPCWLITTRHRDAPDGMVLIHWKPNGDVAMRKLRDGLQPIESDAFAFDPARGMLVHFAGVADRLGPCREEQGGMIVRECGPDGQWREGPDMWPEQGRSWIAGMLAGWDPGRGGLFLIDGHTRGTFLWNGEDLEVLCDYPHALSRPVQASVYEDAPIVYQSVFGTHAAALSRLTAKGWVAIEADGLWRCGGLAHDPRRKLTLIQGACFGPRSKRFRGQQFSFCRVTDGRVEPDSPLLANVQQPVAGGPYMWGTLAESYSVERKDQESFSQPTLIDATDPDQLKAIAGPDDGVPAAVSFDEQGSLGFAYSGGKLTCLRANGSLDRWNAATSSWKRQQPSHCPPARHTSTLGVHANTILLVAGENYPKKLRDTWLFDGADWKRLSARGSPPLREGGLLAYHERLNVWVAAGGTTHDDDDLDTTWECRNGKWREHGHDERSLQAQVLAYDRPSGQLLALTGGGRLMTYRGEGVWERAASLDISGVWAFDPKSRRVCVAKDGSVHAFDVSKWLDAAPAPPSSDAAPADDGEAATSGGPDPAADDAPPQGRDTFLISRTKRGRGDHFGGTPAGITAASWPTCAHCEHPMQFLALLRAHAKRLPLEKHGAIALFCCNGDFSGGSCETWEPHSGCNRALLLTKADLKMRALKRPPASADGLPPMAGFAKSYLKYESTFEVDEKREPDLEIEIHEYPKLGGFPVWRQFAAIPDCSHCKVPMRFVGQFDEMDDSVNFAAGRAYVFSCPQEHEAALLWQK